MHEQSLQSPGCSASPESQPSSVHCLATPCTAAGGDLLAGLDKQVHKIAPFSPPGAAQHWYHGLAACTVSQHRSTSSIKAHKRSPAGGGDNLPAMGHPCPAQQPSHRAVPGILGRAQPPEPHEQGLGTGPAGTQLLPATNKGCLMPGTAGCLWFSGGAWHCSASTTTSLLLPTEQQGTGSGCAGALLVSSCTQGRGAAHQFSLLMWSPKPGVSMTVSFMRTPFSSISEREQSWCVSRVWMGALAKPSLPKSAAGLELAPRVKCTFTTPQRHKSALQREPAPISTLKWSLPTQLTQC